jgi:hypothetical protein
VEKKYDMCADVVHVSRAWRFGVMVGHAGRWWLVDRTPNKLLQDCKQILISRGCRPSSYCLGSALLILRHGRGVGRADVVILLLL